MLLQMLNKARLRITTHLKTKQIFLSLIVNLHTLEDVIRSGRCERNTPCDLRDYGYNNLLQIY